VLLKPQPYRNQRTDGARVTFRLGRKGERADRRFRAWPYNVGEMKDLFVESHLVGALHLVNVIDNKQAGDMR
jgi:hypothetical protein